MSPRGVFIHRKMDPDRLMRRSIERFWSRVNKSDGCWEWTWGRNAAGYGTFRISGKNSLAHRVSMFLSIGEMPKDDVLHKCDNPPCVRPDHLYVGTDKDNVRDCIERGRHYSAAAVNAAKTHCRRGHPYSGANLYLRPDGRGRDCVACRKIVDSLRIRTGRYKATVVETHGLLTPRKPGNPGMLGKAEK